MPGRDSTIRLFLAPPRRLFLHNHYLQSFGLHPWPFPFPRAPWSVDQSPLVCLKLNLGVRGPSGSFAPFLPIRLAITIIGSTYSPPPLTTPLQFFPASFSHPFSSHSTFGVALLGLFFVPLPCNLYLLHRFVCANSLCMLSIFAPSTHHPLSTAHKHPKPRKITRVDPPPPVGAE